MWFTPHAATTSPTPKHTSRDFWAEILEEKIFLLDCQSYTARQFPSLASIPTEARRVPDCEKASWVTAP